MGRVLIYVCDCGHYTHNKANMNKHRARCNVKTPVKKQYAQYIIPESIEDCKLAATFYEALMEKITPPDQAWKSMEVIYNNLSERSILYILNIKDPIQRGKITFDMIYHRRLGIPEAFNWIVDSDTDTVYEVGCNDMGEKEIRRLPKTNATFQYITLYILRRHVDFVMIRHSDKHYPHWQKEYIDDIMNQCRNRPIGNGSNKSVQELGLSYFDPALIDLKNYIMENLPTRKDVFGRLYSNHELKTAEIIETVEKGPNTIVIWCCGKCQYPSQWRHIVIKHAMKCDHDSMDGIGTYFGVRVKYSMVQKIKRKIGEPFDMVKYMETHKHIKDDAERLLYPLNDLTDTLFDYIFNPDDVDTTLLRTYDAFFGKHALHARWQAMVREDKHVYIYTRKPGGMYRKPVTTLERIDPPNTDGKFACAILYLVYDIAIKCAPITDREPTSKRERIGLELKNKIHRRTHYHSPFTWYDLIFDEEIDWNKVKSVPELKQFLEALFYLTGDVGDVMNRDYDELPVTQYEQIGVVDPLEIDSA